MKLIYILILQLTFSLLQAQEIIVLGTAVSEEKVEPSRSNSLVTDSEIDLNKPQTMADFLRSVPGVEVVRQGNVGQTTSVFIRGARSESTLVLIDGVEANDAMSPASGFDFSGLSPENIARIEVYHGPQSVRFGAGALGGVINIITKSGEKSGLLYSVESGSYQTHRASLGNYGRFKKLSYSLAADTISIQGFSAATKNRGNSEDDGAKVVSGSTKMIWNFDSLSKIEGTLRYNQVDTDIDTFGGTGGDDPNNTTQTKQFLTGLSASKRFFDEHLKSSLGFYFSEVTRDGRNLPNTGSTTDSSDYFLSKNRKVESNHEYFLGEAHTLRLGLQWRQESGLSNSVYNGTSTHILQKDQSTTGISVTYLFENETWFFDIGTRRDQNSIVNFVTSYRASIGRFFNNQNSKIYASYGTGFKLPSLYQIYSVYGDESLGEENSQTVEATLEHKFSDPFSIGVTVFENQYRDLIDYDMTANKYFNILQANSKGVELEAKIKVTPIVNLKTTYSYLDSIDETTRLGLLRRPKNTLSMTTAYSSGAFEGYFQYRFKDERPDIDPSTFQRTKNESYDLVNIGGRYTVSNSLKVSARIENLFDKTYEEVAGYGTPGISFYIGLSGEFDQ